jgi:hypothetical protein
MEAEVHQHVMVPWEPPVPLPFKPQPGLFHLLHYMLKKFNRKNSSLDDFKVRLASYRDCPEDGMNGLTSRSWHHLGCGSTKTK